ncbi:MAG: Ig-like domain-containing protein [Limisphaerales bacterium]
MQRLSNNFWVILVLTLLTFSAQGANYTVNIFPSGYSPSSLSINVGDSVTWINQDEYFSHTVTSSNNSWPNQLLVDEGDSVTITFNNAGTYSYYDQFTGNTGTITVTAANSPPIVSITSPTNNTVFHAPATFTITATASDPGGSVTSVQFLLGTTSLGIDTTSPYSITANNIAAGSYTLYAIATDNLGAKATNAVSIIVNSLPSVSITSPAANAVLVAPFSGTFQATAADSDGSITNVAFYRGATFIGQATSSPFAVNINNLAAGTYSLTARAYDNRGGSTLSAPINIRVITNSTLSGLQVVGGQVSLTATTIDGHTYSLQSSSNLVNWVTISTVVASGTSRQFIDSTSAGQTNRFYRVVSQ